jgi:P pilus assembly chaperone PapD
LLAFVEGGIDMRRSLFVLSGAVLLLIVIWALPASAAAQIDETKVSVAGPV